MNVNAKVLYYRLRIIDKDGFNTFSQVLALRLDGSIIMSNMTVYPNPFINNIKLQVNSVKKKTALSALSI